MSDMLSRAEYKKSIKGALLNSAEIDVLLDHDKTQRSEIKRLGVRVMKSEWAFDRVRKVVISALEERDERHGDEEWR